MPLLPSVKGNPRLRQVSRNSKKSKANNIAKPKQEILATAPTPTGLGTNPPAWTGLFQDFIPKAPPRPNGDHASFPCSRTGES